VSQPSEHVTGPGVVLELQRQRKERIPGGRVGSDDIKAVFFGLFLAQWADQGRAPSSVGHTWHQVIQIGHYGPQMSVLFRWTV
jgi:hypothetical protein